MAMKQECEAASYWWTQQLNSNVAPILSQEQISIFQKSLAEILEDKYLNHWYLDDPERGSAFRSISYDNRVIDHVLLESAARAKIPNIKSRLQQEVIMWVDPNLIQVQYGHSPKRHVIYGKAGPADLLMDPSVLRGAAIYNTPPRPHKAFAVQPEPQAVNM
eukprot:TRINITY_DN3488_c0_g1_i1.p1 TRINITY_DN3488_c0_g1~~TRINITY_DN3488_c0_g1_i1.p1  ORF type:complete len:161 (-),score=22.04 TRINITY_DN3488_c0_g1_i1:147-629(-)